MGMCHSEQEWFEAARRNDVDTINRLGPQCITSREARDMPEQYVYHNFTAMMNAAYFGHAQVLDLLVVDEYRELLDHPVYISIMTYKETMVHYYTIPADFSPFYLSILSQSAECLRILCKKYLTDENADLLSFEPPNDVISLLAISANYAIWQVVIEYFGKFAQYIFPQLSFQHLQLAVQIGNQEFVQTVLKMANSNGLCKLASKAVKQYNSRADAAPVRLPREMRADEQAQDACRQLLIGYMLGERLFPVPSYMGGPLPQPRFTIRRFVETERKRGSLNLSVLRYYQQNQQQKEQIFRVYSCGDLHIIGRMHRTGSGFFNVDGYKCDVTDIDEHQYHQTIEMIQTVGYIGIDGEVLNYAANVQVMALASPVVSANRRMSIVAGMPEIRLTAEQWRRSIELPQGGYEPVYEDSCYDEGPAQTVGKMFM